MGENQPTAVEHFQAETHEIFTAASRNLAGRRHGVEDEILCIEVVHAHAPARHRQQHAASIVEVVANALGTGEARCVQGRESGGMEPALIIGNPRYASVAAANLPRSVPGSRSAATSSGLPEPTSFLPQRKSGIELTASTASNVPFFR